MRLGLAGVEALRRPDVDGDGGRGVGAGDRGQAADLGALDAEGLGLAVDPLARGALAVEGLEAAAAVLGVSLPWPEANQPHDAAAHPAEGPMAGLAAVAPP